VAITFQNLGASANPDFNSNTDLSSYANSSWTPPTSGLILLLVASRATSGTTNIPTVSGNNITWTQIATVIAAYRLTLFAADASGSSAGVTTISFAGQTQFFCFASFFHATGVDLSGGVAAAFVQSPVNNGSNVDNLSVTLNAAGNSDNRPISGFFHAANEATTHRANWTEADDLANTFPNTALETQWRDDAFETTASASWASFVSALGIAAELKADTGGGTPASASQPAYLSGPFVASDNQTAYLKGAFDGAEPRLMAYYKLEEATDATTLADSSGRGHTATRQAGSTAQITGVVDNGLDDASDGWFAAPDSDDWDFLLAEGFSLEAWVRVDGTDTAHRALLGRTASSMPNHRWWLMAPYASDTQPVLGLTDDSPIGIELYPSVSITDNQWHHIVFIVTPTSVGFFMDGQFIIAKPHEFVDDFKDTVGTLDIFNRTFETWQYGSDADEIAVWKGVLTEELVAAHYNSGAGRTYLNAESSQSAYLKGKTDGSPATLRAYWKLEEGSSETTFVEEIAGHDASLTVGDVSQVAGKVGNAQRHDGNAAARLAITDHADFEFLLSQGFTFSIWFRTNTNADNGFQPFFGAVQSADDENVYYYGYWNWEGTGENILWGVHTDDGDSFQDWNVQPGILGDDQWHFAVFVLSPTHRAIWIDGQLDRVTVHASDFNGDITGQGNTLSVGIFSRRVVSPETIAFDGDQDEIALWEGCLTEEEITLLYNNGNGRDYREVVSSQPAYLVGGINVQDNQSAYLSGIDTSVDSQGAYLAGKETLSDSQLAFTKGQDDEVSSKEAYLESADTFFDSQPAYLTGQSAGELLRPNGFIANLGNKWHQFPGGASTPLYTVIDEETPDDADYVVHDTPPLQVGDYFEVSLNNPSGTPGSGDHIIRWRARRRGTGAVSITVELRQGASTVIASQEQALTDTDTTYELALSAGEIASISNYDDLRFRWTVTGVG
jgi:hypothetical protein